LAADQSASQQLRPPADAARCGHFNIHRLESGLMLGIDADNPLLAGSELPEFNRVCPEHVEPAVRTVLAAQREQLGAVERATPFDFDSTIQLERIQNAVQRVWAPVSHLNAVRSTPAIRDAYNACLPLITEFWLEFGQNERLYSGFEHLSRSRELGDGVRARLVTNALRDFRLAGVALEPSRRERFTTVSKALAAVQARFEQNLLDATDAFRHHETGDSAVAGLPETFLERAQAAAADEGLSGYLLHLDPPTYTTVMSQAESVELREHFYRAWVTRASDQGPRPEAWDNGALMGEILALRHESAQLLGFDSFAALSLATKMAESPESVLKFLRDLARRSKPIAQREFAELESFAGRRLDAWDVAFYSDRMKRDRFELSAEALRPYFPLPRVLDGLFRVVTTLFGVTLRQAGPRGSWHPDVAYFELVDLSGRAIGGVYTDLYARPNKRGGAWMDGAQSRARIPGLEQCPVAHLICNFQAPGPQRPSLLTHDEVITLFHEFGHALHHLLTEIDYPSLAGTHGVPWDAVELPSQFFENYAWLPAVLPWISSHYQTGSALPADKLATLKASRTFHAGLAMVRQLEFALFDFRLHAEYEPASGPRIEEMLAEVRREVAVVEAPAYNRFPNTFAHIFGGGYAAGYYSYKWAEVLAADAFAAFEEHGDFDAVTARRFRECILGSGGGRDPLAAFTEFRGREPSLEPLLRQSGIATTESGH
jgi:oligopeptidase A